MRFQGKGLAGGQPPTWPDEAEAGPSKILSTAKVGSGRATLPLSIPPPLSPPPPFLAMHLLLLLLALPAAASSAVGCCIGTAGGAVLSGGGSISLSGEPGLTSVSIGASW